MKKISNHDRERIIRNITIYGAAVNILLVIFKFIAGFLGRSAAMLADAAHSLSDLVSDAVVLISARLARKPADKDHNYGHGKYETLAALVIGILLGYAGFAIFMDGSLAIWSFYQGNEIEEPNFLALAAAIISIIVKEALYQRAIIKAKAIDSTLLKVNAWHHRSDAVTSVAALCGISGAMFLGPQWRILDPVSAILVSFFIIKMSLGMIRTCIDELLEKSLPENEVGRITEIIAATPDVLGFHKLRTRRMGASRAIEVHLKLNDDMALREAHRIASQLERALKNEFGSKTHTVIHMEPEHSA